MKTSIFVLIWYSFCGSIYKHACSWWWNEIEKKIEIFQ